MVSFCGDLVLRLRIEIVGHHLVGRANLMALRKRDELSSSGLQLAVP